MNRFSGRRLIFRWCALALLLLAVPLRAASFDSIPDAAVQDQDGRPRHFVSDLLNNKIVAVNFLFTSCATVCPPLGARSAALARELAAQGDDRFQVISISIDPETDTPEKLRAWAANFGAAPGWTLVTGDRREIDPLLRALQAYTADKNLHSGSFLLGNPATGEWRRVDGAVSPAQLAATLHELAAPSAKPAPAPPPVAAAARYFPDVTLLNQNGEPRRFYSDLVRGRVVVIDTIFSDCAAACPILTERFAKVQAALGDRVGRDVFLLSISVDPATDTPEKLHAYATHAGAKPGWEFLTGSKADVDLVLKKLGQYVDSRDAHSNLILVGNEPTGLWKKIFGLAAPEEVVRLVTSVADDRR